MSTGELASIRNKSFFFSFFFLLPFTYRYQFWRTKSIMFFMIDGGSPTSWVWVQLEGDGGKTNKQKKKPCPQQKKNISHCSALQYIQTLWTFSSIYPPINTLDWRSQWSMEQWWRKFRLRSVLGYKDPAFIHPLFFFYGTYLPRVLQTLLMICGCDQE